MDSYFECSSQKKILLLLATDPFPLLDLCHGRSRHSFMDLSELCNVQSTSFSLFIVIYCVFGTQAVKNSSQQSQLAAACQGKPTEAFQIPSKPVCHHCVFLMKLISYDYTHIGFFFIELFCTALLNVAVSAPRIPFFSNVFHISHACMRVLCHFFNDVKQLAQKKYGACVKIISYL